MNPLLPGAEADDYPSNTRSQTDVVVDEIKRMIISGQLSAGSRLPIERDLAVALGVSRGSLREGVRALAMMGVLETRQGAGTYVTSLEPSVLLAPMTFMVDLHTDDSSVHLQAVRRVLETEAAGRAAQFISDDELAEAAAVLERFERLSEVEDIDHVAVMEADISFHRVVARAGRNPALEALIEALANRTVRTRMWRAISEDGVVHVTHSEHRAVLAALRAHDPDAARLRMGTHLLAVEEFVHAHAADAEAASAAAMETPAQ